MPSMANIRWGLSQDLIIPPQLPAEFSIEELPPMRFHEDAWYVLQGTGHNYLHEQRFRETLSDEEVVNRLFIDFHKIPGDIALKVIQTAFNLDFENKDVARALYEASLKVRLLE